MLIFSQRFTDIVRVPNTICPGVAGFVSWTAVFAFICRVKLLPLAVTMVILSSELVACRGMRSCSLCWALWKCMWIFKRKLESWTSFSNDALRLATLVCTIWLQCYLINCGMWLLCIAVMMGTVHHGGNYIIQEIKNVKRCRTAP